MAKDISLLENKEDGEDRTMFLQAVSQKMMVQKKFVSRKIAQNGTMQHLLSDLAIDDRQISNNTCENRKVCDKPAVV
jgi:hypothetical protein